MVPNSTPFPFDVTHTLKTLGSLIYSELFQKNGFLKRTEQGLQGANSQSDSDKNLV